MNQLKSLAITVFVAFIVVACGGGGSSESTDGGTPNLTATAASVGVTMADSSTAASDELLDAILDDCEEASTPEDCAELPDECEEASTPEDCVELPQECEEASTPEDCVEPPVDCPEGPVSIDDDCDTNPQLLIEVTSVVLLGPDGPEEIFSGSMVFNLFKLKAGVELMLLDNEVKPGTYSKIRLNVAGNPLLVTENQPDGVDVKLPSGKIDLNPREEFSIAAGDTVLIKLDWHAHKSLKLNRKQLILRPVIFVDVVINDGEIPDPDERIVRASGIVGEIGTDSFELCMAAFIQPLPLPASGSADDDGEQAGEDCIDVVVTDKTGLFDENGEPQLFTSLATDDPVTVIGLLRRASDEIDECDEASIPESDCNIVTPLSAVASNHKEKHSGKNHSDSDNSDSDNDCDSDSDSDSDNDCSSPPDIRFEIIAAVVEGGVPGTWTRERGTLETAADGMGEFDFRLGGPEGRLLLGKVYEETRIFLVSAEDGITEITAAELQAGDRAIVEAVFVPGDDIGPTPKSEPIDCSEAATPEECQDVPEKLDGTLRIAIMLVTMGDDSLPPGERPDGVVGKLLSVDSQTGQLMVATADGDRCVNTSEETTILQVVVTEDGVEAIKATLADLEIGGLILVAGEDDACVEATLIVAQGPAKPDPVTAD
ncbi:DUF4382 domain-containing protein [Gammaproteobacteria bacterium]|nr:DUF4382 domain-containing protein [Gammaproteobacteria bacterium]